MKKLMGLVALLLGMGVIGWTAKLEPAVHHRGTVVRGRVEYMRAATQGVTLRLRTLEGAPVMAYVGPDALTRPVKVRDLVALTGHKQGDLFLASHMDVESTLSRSVTYPVAFVRNGFAYARAGGGLRRFPVGPGWRGDTVTVSWYGHKPVVE